MTETLLVGENWYGRDFADQMFARTRFVDCDMTESRSKGAVFEECVFVGSAFSASIHHASLFLRCTFRRTSFFDATWEGCKVTGSHFDSCTLRPMTIVGGDWSFVDLSRAKLAGIDFSAVRLDESDFTASDLSRVSFRGARMHRVDLTGARLRETDFVGADISGTDLRRLAWDKTRLDATQLWMYAEQVGIEVGAEQTSEG